MRVEIKYNGHELRWHEAESSPLLKDIESLRSILGKIKVPGDTVFSRVDMRIVIAPVPEFTTKAVKISAQFLADVADCPADEYVAKVFDVSRGEIGREAYWITKPEKSLYRDIYLNQRFVQGFICFLLVDRPGPIHKVRPTDDRQLLTGAPYYSEISEKRLGVLAMRKKGASINAIAAHYRCSGTNIRSILKRFDKILNTIGNKETPLSAEPIPTNTPPEVADGVWFNYSDNGYIGYSFDKPMEIKREHRADWISRRQAHLKKVLGIYYVKKGLGTFEDAANHIMEAIKELEKKNTVSNVQLDR